jgi:hypothetical protein
MHGIRVALQWPVWQENSSNVSFILQALPEAHSAACADDRFHSVLLRA